MKNLFRDLDLYKVIILASVVLLPVVGFWAYHLEGELQRGRIAIANATKPRGHLEEIGKWQQAVEKQVLNQGSGDSGGELDMLYFNKWIVQSAPRLKSTNLMIHSAQDKEVQRKAIDTTIKIDFKDGNKKLPLTREELVVFLFNAESQSPVWKLRDLTIRNASVVGPGGSRKPPPTLEDTWEVQQLEFARRRPLKR